MHQEGVMPFFFFHINPICDDTVLNRMLQNQPTALVLCLISNVGPFLIHADYDTLIGSVP